jgi:hypothetical protein
LGPYIQIDQFPGRSGRFFWGRVPVDRLVSYLESRYDVSSEEEFLDLGTPLREDADTSTIAQRCEDLMAKTNPQSANVCVAVIDRGQHALNATPHDFNGKLAHALTADVRISPHAMQVLSVLLERLDSYGILPETEIVCALVKEQASPINRQTPSKQQCFDQANAVEMLDALKKLRPLLAARGLPVALNMSLGTHVGPHNGESPLEDYIHQLALASPDQYFHVSVGNDGMTGIASRRELTAGIREYLKVRTGPNQPGEILIEFWWREPLKGSLSIGVTVASATGKPLTSSPRINSTPAGSTLATNLPGFNNIVCESLFHARCYNDISCIALALSTKKPPGLPILDLEFTLDCPADVVVNAWITVSKDRLSAFIEGNNEGTVRVPATDPEVLSVAGIESKGQPWSGSSRGPTGVYPGGGPAQSSTAPYIAFLARHRGQPGTSFASPRACAETANIIRDGKRRLIMDLVYKMLNIPSSSSPTWNPRTGFGDIDS